MKPLSPSLSLTWLLLKSLLYIILVLNAGEAVVVAYQQF